MKRLHSQFVSLGSFPSILEYITRSGVEDVWLNHVFERGPVVVELGEVSELVIDRQEPLVDQSLSIFEIFRIRRELFFRELFARTTRAVGMTTFSSSGHVSSGHMYGKSLGSVQPNWL